MKFEKIYITGFGALRDLELDGISPGLNIIEGANEAGKTTMLEFVRALFFGFAQRDKVNGAARRYEPKGGVHGGWAILQNSHHQLLRIERFGGKSSAGDCKVQLLGTARDISIDAVMNGADRALYEQIFAFTLDELSGFSQSDQRVQNRIYAASSGRGSDALFSALKRTGDDAKEIYTKRGRNQSLNKAVSEYRDLQMQIKELSRQVEEYNTDRDQLLECEQNAQELRRNYDAIKKQLDTAKLYAAVWEPWVRLSALRRELKELPAQSEFDAAKASAMTDLKIKLQQQQDAMENLQPRSQRVEAELENCEVDESILRNSRFIKELKEQLGTYESTLRALPLCEQKLENIERQVKVLLEQLGPRWNEGNVGKMDTSREPRLRIQRWGKMLEEQEKNLQDAIRSESATAQQVAQQEQSLQRLQDEIQNEFPVASPEQEELERRANALREAASILRNIENQSLKAEYLRKELTEKQNQQKKKDSYSSITLISKWAIAAPLVIAILTGMVLWREPLWAIIIAGLFAFISVVLFAVSRNLTIVKAQREKEQNQELANGVANLQKQLQSCEEEAMAANARLQLIGEKWGWKLQNQTDHQRYFDELLRDREKRSRYDNLQDDAKRRRGDLEDIQKLQQSQIEKIDSLKSTFREQQGQWEGWLEQHLLPVEISPRQALESFDFIEKARVLLHERNQHQGEIAAMKKQCEDFENSATELGQKLQREMSEKNRLPVAVRALGEELEKQQSLEIKRAGLLENLQSLQDDLETQQKRWQETTKQIERILAGAGCADQIEFDDKVKIAAKREELQQQCKEYEQILESHSAPGAAREKLENDLQNLDAQLVKEQLETAQAIYEETDAEKARADQLLGERNLKVQQREKEEGKLTALLRQLEIQKSTIADLTQQWAVARLIHELLDCTRERFEQERQPAVIKRAGELMSDVTAGRYQSVFATQGLNAVELNEGELGRKPLSHWSRGTKEQFYLALRLAFIEDYCSQEHLEPLPVVMDDVLVHADGYQRLEAASAMIAAFAEKYQVLYFTCRPGDAKVLSQVAPAARRLRLERGKIVTA